MAQLQFITRAYFPAKPKELQEYSTRKDSAGVSFVEEQHQINQQPAKAKPIVGGFLQGEFSME